MEILIRNQSRKKLIPAKRLRQLTQKVLETLIKTTPMKNLQLSVLFVDDTRMKKLNKEFRDVDRATDVLSFPMDDAPLFFKAEDFIILGDIAISLETAARQAGDQGHSLEKEIAVLLTHGLLHLLGYDDETPGKRRRMLSEQKRCIDLIIKQKII